MHKVYPETFTTIMDVFKKYTDWHIHRGAVDWLVWDFEKYPKTLTVSADVISFRDNEIIIGLEYMSPMKEMVDDENLIYAVNRIFELVRFLKQVEQAKAGRWSAILSNDNFIEISDAEYKLQGVSTQILLRFLED